MSAYAAPAFRAHFTDPMYEDPADELAPFGSDEGSDLLYEWDGRRDELGDNSRVVDLIGLAEYNDLQAYGNGEDLDTSVLIVAAAFTLLRLTGRIDPEGHRLALAVLDRLMDYYGPSFQLEQQRDDLASWAG